MYRRAVRDAQSCPRPHIFVLAFVLVLDLDLNPILNFVLVLVDPTDRQSHESDGIRHRLCHAERRQ
ncbi:hypothetical protein CC85DRAFT_287168 [Cutaneotrichosporon oleaginosum]|uniref:Uncharacterized protein n=1 Tax=Cutaneotrichosporon oleaginosum TaxID=879819 RepID=A0A0J0XI00_9TREE|nr:uncharacterized protein CC85DRAFT_287168 [Cutaneotrichosporon oleaginosum]KLT40755.1 hypothetical protein CC85DRAFT_287168 [Cutaneotrichosporon oleaginosum]TXT06789.1 hypothetical protein COLE_06120 [Cutaneotrichosporon oleaginosum]